MSASSSCLRQCHVVFEHSSRSLPSSCMLPAYSSSCNTKEDCGHGKVRAARLLSPLGNQSMTCIIDVAVEIAVAQPMSSDAPPAPLPGICVVGCGTGWPRVEVIEVTEDVGDSESAVEGNTADTTWSRKEIVASSVQNAYLIIQRKQREVKETCVYFQT